MLSLHPFMEMHLSRQRRVLRWEKKKGLQSLKLDDENSPNQSI